MKITEKRTITRSALRNLCVEKDWYTYGTNEEYDNILNFVASNEMTTENIAKVATDIFEHSNKNCFKDCEANGTTALKYVLFELAEIAHTFFYDEDEGRN